MKLSELPIGEKAKILKVNGEGALRDRLLDMGLTPGTEVTMIKAAPLGDPLELRTRGYELAADHGGVMDTTIKGEFAWAVCDHLALTAYVAYSDYWFDSKLREGARIKNGEWGSACDHSWNFYGGVGVTVSF